MEIHYIHYTKATAMLNLKFPIKLLNTEKEYLK